MGGRERDTGRFTSKMMKYDPSRDKWIQLSGMRRSKVSFSLNIMDKHIVITGKYLPHIYYMYSGRDQCGYMLILKEARPATERSLTR